jgi:5-methylcytosine-specific restriction endonuclease McrA
MKKASLLFLVTVSILFFTEQAFSQRGSRSSGSSHRSYNYSIPRSSSKAYSSPAYESGGTKYKVGESYKSSGLPKVERSSSAKKEFLKQHGYQKVPQGYQVDHIVPLSKGGADQPSNMQLLPTEIHKNKTASERKTH